MKAKTNRKNPPKKQTRKEPQSLGLEALKESAVRTGIMAGGIGVYSCNHISDGTQN